MRAILETDKTVRVALVIVAAGVVMAALVYGAAFLIPLVVAFILANILEAAAERLARLGVPWWLGLTATILALIVLLLAIALIAIDQVQQVQSNWPAYRQRVSTLIDQLRSDTNARAIDLIASEVQSIDLASLVRAAFGSVGNAVSASLLTFLYTGFLLAERGRTLKRVARIAKEQGGHPNPGGPLTAISESVRQYLYLKTILSLATALGTYAFLRLFGIDLAETLALLAFLLNFIPTIGSTAAAVLPSLMALAVLPSLQDVLILFGCLAALQLVIGNFIEPVLMGRGLNLRPVVIIISLVFWTTVWGVPGAFLAVPITAAIVLAAREVDGLRWVVTLLSDDVRDDLGADEQARHVS